jgi:hypothetical protein
LADPKNTEQIWLPVIGRALAFLCLHAADKGSKTISEKAVFLSGLGVEAEDCARMLDTTPASVRELLRLSKNKTNKRGRRKNAAAKKKR